MKMWESFLERLQGCKGDYRWEVGPGPFDSRPIRGFDGNHRTGVCPIIAVARKETGQRYGLMDHNRAAVDIGFSSPEGSDVMRACDRICNWRPDLRHGLLNALGLRE